ncbi:MAG: oxygen-dependent coproporphyrinogen-III oxidase [Melioribacteraceae bacterium]|nr:MAG: oxygen-dependent coproporphyrinogen-III oxidase [Melioribacteraceae bacterium]
MKDFISSLQDEITGTLGEIDGKSFSEDSWERPGGGGGRTRVIENGSIFEKGGVNISDVHGELPPEAAAQLNVKPGKFGATGISIVIHPHSPKIPTIHMNVRYFETESGKAWFGGGIDLTPYFPYEEDFVFFHKVMSDACESVITGSYPAYKTQCDEYFTIKHRNEMRGIGGIFFDYLDGKNPDHFALVKSTGNSFLKAYLPIVKKRKAALFTDDEKNFQLHRRGRYVEFNLVYDRGTVFGLKTGGRIESILMSLPPVVHYNYDPTFENGSQFDIMNQYYQPKDWLNYE